MNKYVVNPLGQEELISFLDNKSKNVIKYFIKKSLFAQPESKKQQNKLPIQIPKEHIEQWFTQALNVKPLGSGSYPVDIYNEKEHWGADIKMLGMKILKSGKFSSSTGGEASLGQKFTDTGLDLDKLFSEKKHDDIKDGWINLFKNKYASFKKDYPLVEKIYYFFILRPGARDNGADFYFTGAILNLNQLEKVVVNEEKTTAKNVRLTNFIDDDYGNAQIYKSKKRLELRLRAKKWIETGCALKISTNFNNNHVDLREQEINDLFFGNEIEKIKDVKITFEDEELS